MSGTMAGADGRRTIEGGEILYAFHPDLAAQWTVRPGEPILVRCPDGVGGVIRDPGDRYHAVDYDRVNGCVGPIAVEGAEPGDRLVFAIDDITVPQAWGYVLVIPKFGLLQSHVDEAATRIVPIADGRVRFGGLSIPLDPCIGTIGTAPAAGRFSTVIPHEHGGNMVTTAIRKGARVHFPVNRPGGMLALGDPKAVMGDGEVCGTGVGVPIDVAARISLVKGGRLPRPVIETADDWQFVASADTLEAACRLATEDLIDALVRAAGLSWTDGYMRASLVGDLRISQVVDPLMTVRMCIARRYLPAIDAPA
ncbi:MAG: acetamidase/formamidase family protein [Rhodospirillales bacterium]